MGESVYIHHGRWRVRNPAEFLCNFGAVGDLLTNISRVLSFLPFLCESFPKPKAQRAAFFVAG